MLWSFCWEVNVKMWSNPKYYVTLSLRLSCWSWRHNRRQSQWWLECRSWSCWHPPPFKSTCWACGASQGCPWRQCRWASSARATRRWLGRFLRETSARKSVNPWWFLLQALSLYMSLYAESPRATSPQFGQLAQLFSYVKIQDLNKYTT